MVMHIMLAAVIVRCCHALCDTQGPRHRNGAAGAIFHLKADQPIGTCYYLYWVGRPQMC